MEFKLGNDVYLVVSLFNDETVVHIRKYDLKKDGIGKYPTKIGVCLTPKRFVSLITNFDDIDNMYKYVSRTDGEWRTIHIGGELYASVTNDYKCINLRHFYRSENNKALPGRQGIALTLPMWSKLKKHALELREADEVLKNATLCMNGTDHANQMGFFECGECVPFVGSFYGGTNGCGGGDADDNAVELPPRYNSSLQCPEEPPPAKKQKKMAASTS